MLESPRCTTCIVNLSKPVSKYDTWEFRLIVDHKHRNILFFISHETKKENLFIIKIFQTHYISNFWTSFCATTSISRRIGPWLVNNFDHKFSTPSSSRRTDQATFPMRKVLEMHTHRKRVGQKLLTLKSRKSQASCLANSFLSCVILQYLSSTCCSLCTVQPLQSCERMILNFCSAILLRNGQIACCLISRGSFQNSQSVCPLSRLDEKIASKPTLFLQFSNIQLLGKAISPSLSPEMPEMLIHLSGRGWTRQEENLSGFE